ncbi:MAG TPA: hypothetical protein VJ385_00200, partial [Fibrobacteria bacterium]|nr:hypothetical protein [Fibrobacteria bacterium]
MAFPAAENRFLAIFEAWGMWDFRAGDPNNVGEYMSNRLHLGLFGALACLAALQLETYGQAKWTYSNCADVTDADF